MQPLSIAPSGYWNGNDGPWSTFELGLGSDKQSVKVLISTSSNTPWVVVPEGCNTAEDEQSCYTSRGGIYNRTSSSSYEELGQFALGFEENLGYVASGLYFNDTLSLGYVGSGAPTLENQVVAGIRTEDFWIGSWGIHPSPLNFTDISDPVRSVVSTLKYESKIPSLSWGYTAGSHSDSQQSKPGALGSLTLGGYDTSLLEPHDTEFSFGSDTSRDLLVGIQTLHAPSSQPPILSSPILAFIDAGTPHIWLPRSACDALESAYSLTYNSTLDRYLLPTVPLPNENLTLSLGNDQTSSPTVQISLPLSSLNLTLTSDFAGIHTDTPYFPLRRAANDTQFTLGRAFLQHAYIIANYENSTFRVHQSRFAPSYEQTLVSIPAAGSSSEPTDPAHPPESLSKAATAGVSIAAATLFALLALAIWTFYRRARTHEHSGHPLAAEVEAREKPELAARMYLPPALRRVFRPRNAWAGKSAVPVHELEVHPVELEVPRVNHEVPAREMAVAGGADEDGTGSWGSRGSWGNVDEKGYGLERGERFELP